MVTPGVASDDFMPRLNNPDHEQGIRSVVRPKSRELQKEKVFPQKNSPIQKPLNLLT